MAIIHCTHGFNRTGYMVASYLARMQVGSHPAPVAPVVWRQRHRPDPGCAVLPQIAFPGAPDLLSCQLAYGLLSLCPQSMTMPKALAMFAHHRPPGIYKHYYIRCEAAPCPAPVRAAVPACAAPGGPH